jgi:hypothetical protein
MRRGGAGGLTARLMYAGGPQFGYSQKGALD